jgi:hypothetical protein
MPPRHHDPFNDAPRRPTHDTYTAGGGHVLRANTAARNLFAPTHPRRPTTTASSSNHQNELVLEDSDDAADRMSRRAAAAGRATRARRPRAHAETTIEPDHRDMVVRDERGNYLREVPALAEQSDAARHEGILSRPTMPTPPPTLTV